ncbi:MAG TPA: hypothetical protein VM056_05760 [Terriglobales bacterium]|nr:hypothetical protein [Terriglobales bacterium]
MPAPLRSSSDIPEFATYPSAPTDQYLSAEPAPALNRQAERLGTALGQGMATVFGASDRAKNRLSNLTSIVSEKLCDATSMLSEKYDDARLRSVQIAQEKFDVTMETAQAQVRKAKQFAEDRPVAVILAAGVAGLALGAGIRTWRNRRG